MTNKRLNWRRKEVCELCQALDNEGERERIAAQTRTNPKNKKNHLAHRYHQINKRRHQHDDLFHADIDALEREVNVTYCLSISVGSSNLILSVQEDSLLQVSKDFMPAEIQTV